MGADTVKATLTIAAMAALALFVFSLWGLRGSLVLIALWGFAYLGFSLWHRRAQRLIRERLARMDERQRANALSALSETDRIEVFDAIKVHER
ncbi:MAG: hypothetical protein KJ017_04080 [Alphaproteobacteria bacterium]|nr:hypothetical protein [Alphaproteobacteria bacterium]